MADRKVDTLAARVARSRRILIERFGERQRAFREGLEQLARLETTLKDIAQREDTLADNLEELEQRRRALEKLGRRQ